MLSLPPRQRDVPHQIVWRHILLPLYIQFCKLFTVIVFYYSGSPMTAIVTRIRLRMVSLGESFPDSQVHRNADPTTTTIITNIAQTTHRTTGDRTVVAIRLTILTGGVPRLTVDSGQIL